jgi:hypothetical protein
MTHFLKCIHRRRLFFIAMICLLLISSCKEDRTTIVFGKVVDQNQQPVDSIMVLASGTRQLHSERIQHTFTEKGGHYEMAIEVPKKYVALDIILPHLPVENPKYEWHYKISKIFTNGRRTDDCCAAPIGKKTQWDYELAPR